ncbi:hypothetical protein [Nocardia sp. SYP-A9097]|uniref:hypothetical protein n=1 Tax=Nocardia sp. SYP-A9097 TaxID=2663237 RepID=UPI00129A50D8|nr:hypothetical protein [Nocardia sp. SYP-A9097]
MSTTDTRPRVPAARLATRRKAGRESDENDDRAIVGSRPRFALADGAFTTARPEVWAEILAWAFVVDGLDVLDLDVLEELRADWARRVHDEQLPWYALAKLQSGGAAAFVGVDVDVVGHRYQVVAVGDSCLLHLRAGRVIAAGPLDHPSQFGSRPPLISTRAGDRSHGDSIWAAEKPYLSGDQLVLASDAAAKFLLKRHHSGELLDLSAVPWNDCDFRVWVTAARQEGMDNDDTTICLVEP